MKAYIGVNGKAKAASKMYVGVGGKAKKVAKAYVGDEGCRARLFYDSAKRFAGRKVYRHATLPGSTIEYNEFGTAKKLFVADATYRGTAQIKTSTTPIPGLLQWLDWYYPTCTDNVVNSTTGYTDLSRVASLVPYENKLTDAHFQAALTVSLKPYLLTAKEATDFMISAGNCTAATLCRSRSIGVQLQVPNLYQLLVVYAMGDVIDSLDPTVGANPNYALGYVGSRRWSFGGREHAWSSTSAGASLMQSVHNIGSTYSADRTTTYGVIPVAEL